jgi:hypothetical protein
LIGVPPPGIVARWERGKMRFGAGVALALALVAGGCSSSASKCPKPAVYDDATLKKIEKAREALPKDSVLLQVLEDYENERDDLRFCR